MKQHIVLSSLLSVLFFALPAHAGTETATISLDDALKAVADQTPALKAQRDLIELAKRDRTTRWLPREPSFSFAENDYASSQQYSLSLSVPFPAKVFEAQAADDMKVQNAEREYHARIQDTFRTLTEAYVTCAAARETLKLTLRAGDDLTTFSNFITRQYESGLSSQSEKIGVELQLAQTRSDLESAKITADSSCRKWTTVTESLVGTALPVPADLPSDIAPDTLAKTGDESSETLRATQALSLAQITERNAFWSQAPDISFSVNRNHYFTTQAAPLPMEWSTSYMVSMSIPIFFLWNERTEVQRAKAMARQDQEAARVAQAQAQVDQKDLCSRWNRGAARLHEIEGRDLPMAEAWIESTEAAYRRGRVGFAEILLARKTIFDLRNQIVQTKSNVILNHLRSLGSKCS